MKSDIHPGHYFTFLEMCEKPTTDLSEGDEGIPTGTVGKCENCSSFWFSSKTEMQRHKSLFHRHPPNQQRPGKHICRFKIANAESSAERECGLQIPSAYRLAQHRKQAMHTKRGQTSEPDSVPPKRPREGEGSRENRGRQLDEEVERCAICALTDEDEVDGDRGWIECDICGCW